jgi:hypothetical protein
MRYLLIPLVTVLASACSPNADTAAFDKAMQSHALVTFEDLFGLDSARARAELPSELFRCLSEAHEDFNLVLENKEPMHAKPAGAVSDGGTTAWEGSCYSLAALRQLTTICTSKRGIDGVIVGPSLHIRPNIGRIELAPIARTRFVATNIGDLPQAEFVGCKAP